MKKRKKAFFNVILKAALVLVLLLSFSMCSFEPEVAKDAVELVFSADTIQFDTLFTGRQSITKRLKIINPNNEAVLIEKIELTDNARQFKLIINGEESQTFSDELLFGNDSLLVLLKATIDQSDINNPFVLRDMLAIENKGRSQSVIIEAWGQNAHFLNDSIISENQTWIADKPYVISNSILIDSSAKLTIKEGVKIYSSLDSYIFVQGKMAVSGKADSLVTFTNDRLDEPFASTVGQWGGIVFLAPSTGNSIKFATITNSIVGLNLTTYSPDGVMDLTVENTSIGNTSSAAILCLNSDFEATNSLFYNTVGGTVAHVGGGTANYVHCTIANYFPAQRDAPAAYFADYAIDNNGVEIIAPMNVSLVNSIFYGRNDEEILFFEFIENNIRLTYSHNIFKTNQDILSFNNSLINEDPEFLNTASDNFSLEEGSPARNSATNTGLMIDIQGILRNDTPDIGAFEFRAEEEN